MTENGHGYDAAAARVALDIAVRYGLHRKQFRPGADEPETLILDYLVHQRRLLPLVARVYALQFDPADNPGYAPGQRGRGQRLHPMDVARGHGKLPI